MAAALAVIAIIAWLHFFEVSWAPWGRGYNRSLEVRRGSSKPLSSSGGLLGVAVGVLEGSGSRLGGLLAPNGSHFETFFGSLFRTFLGTEFGTRCFIDFC